MNKKLTIECRANETAEWSRVGALENASMKDAQKFIERVKKNTGPQFEYRITEQPKINLPSTGDTVCCILRVDDLLRANWKMFNHMHDLTYSNEDKEKALKKYYENFNEIRSLINVEGAYTVKKERDSIERVRDVKDSQEYVEPLVTVVHQEFSKINEQMSI